jgi:hypothetical protein
MNQLQSNGHGADDHSGLVQYYEDLAGTEIGRVAS